MFTWSTWLVIDEMNVLRFVTIFGVFNGDYKNKLTIFIALKSCKTEKKLLKVTKNLCRNYCMWKS